MWRHTIKGYIIKNLGCLSLRRCYACIRALGIAPSKKRLLFFWLGNQLPISLVPLLDCEGLGLGEDC